MSVKGKCVGGILALFKRDEKFPLPGMKFQFLTGVLYTMR